jgi:hypothetical protein
MCVGPFPTAAFLEFFITAVDEWGPWGYVAYAAVYTALEVLAVPGAVVTVLIIPGWCAGWLDGWMDGWMDCTGLARQSVARIVACVKTSSP